MLNIPDPNVIFPNEFGTSCFVKNVVHAPNIEIGDYTYYDDDTDPTGFERNNILFNYPEFGDRLMIGKFCAIAQGTTFIMGPANHRTGSASTYPFNVFGGAWTEATPDHMSQLPRKFWPLANNSFLLHGYHNYCHLLLIEEDSRLWLGVPGTYAPQEARAADLFGFPRFTRSYAGLPELTAEERADDEDFGHWCRCVGNVSCTGNPSPR